MSDQPIQCRFCNGPRRTLGGVCLGCGMPVANARDNRRPAKKRPRRCPRCRSDRCTEVSPGEYKCNECSADFENDDFSFVDDRPEENLDKKSRKRRRQRRC
mgnify:CR=1 FL=1